MSAEQLRDEADRILARYARRDDLQGSHFQQYRDIARHERHRVYSGNARPTSGESTGAGGGGWTLVAARATS